MNNSLYFISDTHFSHKNIIPYSNRPFSSIQEMDEKFISNWNELVKSTDIIWHLGDFGFLPLKDLKILFRRLNGNKNLLIGNHDKSIIQNQSILLNEGFINSLQHYKELKGFLLDKKMIVLNHYAQRVWNKSHYGSYMLYGHSHGSLPPYGLSVDVGVDCKEITSEYRPIHLDEIIKYMTNREVKVVDHHQERK